MYKIYNHLFVLIYIKTTSPDDIKAVFFKKKKFKQQFTEKNLFKFKKRRKKKNTGSEQKKEDIKLFSTRKLKCIHDL